MKRAYDGLICQDLEALTTVCLNMNKTVLDMLGTGQLRLREFIVERITVIKFGVDGRVGRIQRS